MTKTAQDGRAQDDEPRATKPKRPQRSKGDGETDNNEASPGNSKPQLVVARKHTTSREIMLWMTPSEAPKALQASECSELLDPMRASCWISAQH